MKIGEIAQKLYMGQVYYIPPAREFHLVGLELIEIALTGARSITLYSLEPEEKELIQKLWREGRELEFYKLLLKIAEDGRKEYIVPSFPPKN